MAKFNLTLDASQLHEYLTCPLKWYYSYKENLQVKGLDSAALAKGNAVHSILEMFYRTENVNRFKAAQWAVDFFKETKVCESLGIPDSEEFLIKRFTQYVVRYEHDDFKILTHNNIPGVELGFSKLLYEDEKVRFIVEGRIDIINELNGGLPCFTDHKSQDRVNYLYAYRPQFLTYSWATGYEWGMLNYFGLQKEYKENISFRRELINIPKWMVDEWEFKMLRTFWDIYYSLNQENCEAIIYANRNHAACAGAFESHPCQFTNICESEWEMKQSIKEFKYSTKETWKPWKLEEETKKS